MAKYLKLFETTSQYNTYINGTPDLPNVSLCEDAPTTVHYTPYVPAPPSNPITKGYYTDTLNPIAENWYPKNFKSFPIIIDQLSTHFVPSDGESMIRLWVKKGTTLANGLMSVYSQYGTNNIATWQDGWGNTLFANYGLKKEGDCKFYKFHEVYNSNSNSEICFDIVLAAAESENPGKIYYEDQSGNKDYLFEWYGI